MLIAKKLKIIPLIIFIGLSDILSSCSQKKNTGFDGKIIGVLLMIRQL